MSALLADLIKSYAARFIKDFHPDDLRVDWWQGVVTWVNVELNTRELELALLSGFDGDDPSDIQSDSTSPLMLEHASAASIVVRLPWAAPFSRPVEIEITGLRIVMNLSSAVSELFSADDAMRRNGSPMGRRTPPASSGFSVSQWMTSTLQNGIEKLRTHVLRTFSLTIRDVSAVAFFSASPHSERHGTTAPRYCFEIGLNSISWMTWSAGAVATQSELLPLPACSRCAHLNESHHHDHSASSSTYRGVDLDSVSSVVPPPLHWRRMSVDGLRVVIQHPRDSFHVKPSSSPHVADPQVSSDHLNCNILAPTDFDIKVSFADDPGLPQPPSSLRHLLIQIRRSRPFGTEEAAFSMNPQSSSELLDIVSIPSFSTSDDIVITVRDVDLAALHRIAGSAQRSVSPPILTPLKRSSKSKEEPAQFKLESPSSPQPTESVEDDTDQLSDSGTVSSIENFELRQSSATPMGSYTRFEHICITVPSIRIELIEHVVEVVRQPSATAHAQSAMSDSAKADEGKHTRPIFSPPLLVGTPHQHRAAWAAPHVLSRPLLSLRIGGIRMTKWRCSDRSVDDSLLAWLQARNCLHAELCHISIQDRFNVPALWPTLLSVSACHDDDVATLLTLDMWSDKSNELHDVVLLSDCPGSRWASFDFVLPLNVMRRLILFAESIGPSKSAGDMNSQPNVTSVDTSPTQSLSSSQTIRARKSIVGIRFPAWSLLVPDLIDQTVSNFNMPRPQQVIGVRLQCDEVEACTSLLLSRAFRSGSLSSSLSKSSFMSLESQQPSPNDDLNLYIQLSNFGIQTMTSEVMSRTVLLQRTSELWQTNVWCLKPLSIFLIRQPEPADAGVDSIHVATRVHLPPLVLQLTRRDFWVLTTVAARASEMRDEDLDRLGAARWMLHAPSVIKAALPQPSRSLTEFRIMADQFCIAFADDASPDVALARLEIESIHISQFLGALGTQDMSLLRLSLARLRLLDCMDDQCLIEICSDTIVPAQHVPSSHSEPMLWPHSVDEQSQRHVWHASPSLRAFHQTMSSSPEPRSALKPATTELNVAAIAWIRALMAPAAHEACVCCYLPRASTALLNPIDAPTTISPQIHRSSRSNAYDLVQNLCSTKKSALQSPTKSANKMHRDSLPIMLSDAWINTLRVNVQRIQRLQQLGPKLFAILDTPVASLSPATLARLNAMSSEQLARLYRRLRLISSHRTPHRGHTISKTFQTPARTAVKIKPTTSRTAQRLASAHLTLTELFSRHIPATTSKHMPQFDDELHRIRRCDLDAYRAAHRAHTQVHLNSFVLKCSTVNDSRAVFCLSELQGHVLTAHAPLAPTSAPWLRLHCVAELQLQTHNQPGVVVLSATTIDFTSFISTSAKVAPSSDRNQTLLLSPTSRPSKSNLLHQFQSPSTQAHFDFDVSTKPPSASVEMLSPTHRRQNSASRTRQFKSAVRLGVSPLEIHSDSTSVSTVMQRHFFSIGEPKIRAQCSEIVALCCSFLASVPQHDSNPKPASPAPVEPMSPFVGTEPFLLTPRHESSPAGDDFVLNEIQTALKRKPVVSDSERKAKAASISHALQFDIACVQLAVFQDSDFQSIGLIAANLSKVCINYRNTVSSIASVASPQVHTWAASFTDLSVQLGLLEEYGPSGLSLKWHSPWLLSTVDAASNIFSTANLGVVAMVLENPELLQNAVHSLSACSESLDSMVKQHRHAITASAAIQHRSLPVWASFLSLFLPKSDSFSNELESSIFPSNIYLQRLSVQLFQEIDFKLERLQLCTFSNMLSCALPSIMDAPLLFQSDQPPSWQASLIDSIDRSSGLYCTVNLLSTDFLYSVLPMLRLDSFDDSNPALIFRLSTDKSQAQSLQLHLELPAPVQCNWIAEWSDRIRSLSTELNCIFPSKSNSSAAVSVDQALIPFDELDHQPDVHIALKLSIADAQSSFHNSVFQYFGSIFGFESEVGFVVNVACSRAVLESVRSHAQSISASCTRMQSFCIDLRLDQWDVEHQSSHGTRELNTSLHSVVVSSHWKPALNRLLFCIIGLALRQCSLALDAAFHQDSAWIRRFVWALWLRRIAHMLRVCLRRVCARAEESIQLDGLDILANVCLNEANDIQSVQLRSSETHVYSEDSSLRLDLGRVARCSDNLCCILSKHDSALDVRVNRVDSIHQISVQTPSLSISGPLAKWNRVIGALQTIRSQVTGQLGSNSPPDSEQTFKRSIPDIQLSLQVAPISLHGSFLSGLMDVADYAPCLEFRFPEFRISSARLTQSDYLLPLDASSLVQHLMWRVVARCALLLSADRTASEHVVISQTPFAGLMISGSDAHADAILQWMWNLWSANAGCARQLLVYRIAALLLSTRW